MIMSPNESSYKEESNKKNFDGQLLGHMVNAFMIRSSNNNVESDEERISPSLKNVYSNFGLENHDNIDVNDGYIYNRNGTFPIYTDNSYHDSSNQKLNDQLNEQAQHEKCLNIFRERFNEQNFWSQNTQPVQNPIESTPVNYNFSRRHNSFNIIGDKTSFNGFNSRHENLFDVGNGFRNQMNNNEQSSFAYQNCFSNSFEQNTVLFQCLDQNCKNKIQQKIDQNLVKFQCTCCHSIKFMHQGCFVKNSRPINRRNSCNSLQTKQKEIRIACFDCASGFLKADLSCYSPQFMYKQVEVNKSNFKQGATKTKYNNKNKQQQQQPNPKLMINNNQHSSISFRKKSLGINPSLPIPMQSVRESRSPSPINPAVLSNKRLSVPVNMPKNRFRTVSTGSTGTSSSSFSPNLSISNQNFLNTDALRNFGSLSNVFSTSLNMNDLSVNFEEKLAQSGNIFHTRKDWSVLKKVPLEKQNSIHIRLEDEGPYGNDETRCFLLSHFSTLGIRAMSCVLCRCQLNIYDRFPLIDGVFYSSPLNYNNNNTKQLETDPKNPDSILSVSATISKKKQSIYAVCLSCLNTNNNHVITCKACKRPWTGGAHLQIGTMYRYEIFAAFPCCEKRFTCKKCNTVIPESENLKHFSSFSEQIQCPKCNVSDYHFVKPLGTFYHNHS